MFDAKDLLGKLMQAKLSGSSHERITHAMGPRGMAQSGNPLGDLLGGLLGKGGAQGGGGLGGLLGQGGGIADLGRRAEEMLGAPRGSVQNTLQDKNQLAMGGLAALAGAVLGGRRGMGGAVGGGLLALLGSLAFSALKNKGASAQSSELIKEAPLGLREPQNAAEEGELQNTALLVTRAMINAAKADGAIDGSEMSRIMGKLSEDGTDSEARDFVMSELQKPLDLDSLVRNVKSPERAVQIYGASLLAIEVDTQAERDYLEQLAQRLGLDGETVERVHSSLGVTKAES